MSAQPRGPASVAVTLGFWLGTVLVLVPAFVGFCVLFALTAPFDPTRGVLHAYASRVCHALLHLNPAWDVRVEDGVVKVSGA